MLDECEKVATAYVEKHIRIIINSERTNFTTYHKLDQGTEISFDGMRYEVTKASTVQNNVVCHDIKAIHED